MMYCYLPRTNLGLSFLFCSLLLDSKLCHAFSTWSTTTALTTQFQRWQQHCYPRFRTRKKRSRVLLSTDAISATGNDKTSTNRIYEPIFNFSNPDEDAVNKFERIDDAIMGGISLSSIKQLPNEDFARWSGVCRIDGGGFCGTRTMPFETPLEVQPNAEGYYILCRLTSDNEPERRVWKMTTRTEDSRGEQLYQATFYIPKNIQQNNTNTDDNYGEWQRIMIPFTNFVQVRGPRLVPNAPSLNTTNGLYQIGISLSKFQIGENVTELENFRPGYFELQIKEIGLYSVSNVTSISTASTSKALLKTGTIRTLSKEEVQQKRSLVLKFLAPISKLFFSEKSRRRKSAWRLLRQRGYSRLQILRCAFRNRDYRKGKFRAIVETLSLIVQDVIGILLQWTLRFSIFYPIVFSLRFFKFFTSFLKRITTSTQ